MQHAKATNLRLDLVSDLQKWRTFLAIAELGSLTRAALFLDTNQSLLSRQLNALERECGARLFNRTGRGVALSDAGQRIFPEVKALLADAERLQQEILGEAREPAGRVVIGSIPSITNPIAGHLFQRVRSRFPSIHLKILEGSSGQVDEWMADARIDIAILYRYGKSLSPNEQALATVDSYLIGPVGDRLTSAGEVPFSALDGLPFILPGAPNGLRNALDAVAKQERITLEAAIEADSLPLMRSGVAEAGLYTVLPIHAVSADVKQGRLQAAKIVSPPMQRIVSMELTRTKSPAKAVSAVAAEIAAIVAEGTRSGIWISGALG